MTGNYLHRDQITLAADMQIYAAVTDHYTEVMIYGTCRTIIDCSDA
jgi:hypothetical protein